MKNDERVYESTLYYCVLRRLSSGISTIDRCPIIGSNDDIIQLQSIASGDKALIDMISVNPIERIFMYNDEAIVKYRYSLVSLPETKYLCEKICLNREKRLSINKSVNLDVLSKSLEQALLDLFKCY